MRAQPHPRSFERGTRGFSGRLVELLDYRPVGLSTLTIGLFGKPTQELARTKPNPMLNAHQEWIEGLTRAAAQRAKS
jgi:hypothetical protein